MLPAILATTMFSHVAAASEISENLDISGFARGVAGYLDHNARTFEGYTDELSVVEQSLIAIQPTYTFNDQFSLTSQLIAHAGDDRNSGLEWLYLNYHPDSAWHLRAGKLRMPFFIYSDSIDVGYSYPWVTAPVQVYNNYLFSTFNGASASYNHSGSEVGLNVEIYSGTFDGDLYLAGTRVDVDAKVSNLAGIVATINSNNLSMRLSYHTGQNDTTVPLIQDLRQALYQNNFIKSAESLESSGNVYALQASLSYDRLNSFYKAEWVQTVTGFEIAPKVTGAYAMAGYIWNNWTVHATYSVSKYSEIEPVVELPTTPIGNPGIDQLSAAYYQAFTATPNGTLDSYTLGTRWDFRLDMALKAEVSKFQESRNPSGFFVNSGQSSKESAYLYQVAWEWIF